MAAMRPRQVRSVVLALVCLLVVPFARAAAQVVTVDLDGVVLSVSASRTAQIFHVVDQLSEWDQFTHKGYGRWAARTGLLDQIARDLLKQHAELRRGRGWDRGFEQSFYVTGSIEDAGRRAFESGALTEQEVKAEVTILRHFDRVLAPLLERGDGTVAAFIDRIKKESTSLRPVIAKLQRLAEAQQPTALTVYLVPNPEEGSGGGGAHGDRLVVEVQQKPDPLPFLVHEALHLLLDRHRPAVAAAAESAGLTWQRLNEGIAYAMAPGITNGDASGDALADAWTQRTMSGAGASDTFVQFYMVAMVIRPLLREALEQGDTITTFLPKAVAKWRSVVNR